MAVAVKQAVVATFPNGSAGDTATCSVTTANDGLAHSFIAIPLGNTSNGGGAYPAFTISDGGSAYANAISPIQIHGTGAPWLETDIFYAHNRSANTTYSVVATNPGGGSFQSYGSFVVLDVTGLAVAGPVTNGTATNANSGSSSATTGNTGSISALTDELLVSCMCATGSSGDEGFTEPPTGITGMTNQKNSQNSGSPGYTCYSVDTLTGGSISGVLNAAYGSFAHTPPWVAAMAVFAPIGGTGYTLSASYGTFSISGENVTFTAATSIPDLLAASGTYSISFASSSSDFNLIAATAVFSYTGYAAQLVPVFPSQTLTAAVGTYSIAAQTAVFSTNSLIAMPNVLGETPAAAFAQLSSLGCTNIDTVSVPSASSNNVVFAQAPNPGTPIITTYPITLWFYSGGSAAAEAGLAVWGR